MKGSRHARFLDKQVWVSCPSRTGVWLLSNRQVFIHSSNRSRDVLESDPSVRSSAHTLHWYPFSEKGTPSFRVFFERESSLWLGMVVVPSGPFLVSVRKD